VVLGTLINIVWLITLQCCNPPSLVPQLQMEKLASRHAITELMSWISLMENIIKEDQNKIMGAVGSEVVQNFLQKYKVQKHFVSPLFLWILAATSHSHDALSSCRRVSG